MQHLQLVQRRQSKCVMLAVQADMEVRSDFFISIYFIIFSCFEKNVLYYFVKIIWSTFHKQHYWILNTMALLLSNIAPISRHWTHFKAKCMWTPKPFYGRDKSSVLRLKPGLRSVVLHGVRVLYRPVKLFFTEECTLARVQHEKSCHA